MTEGQSEGKWTIERIHKEIYDARTKVFVVAKVLETGSIKPAEQPEWVLVLTPLLKDLVDNVEKIRAMMVVEAEADKGA